MAEWLSGTGKRWIQYPNPKALLPNLIYLALAMLIVVKRVMYFKSVRFPRSVTGIRDKTDFIAPNPDS